MQSNLDYGKAVSSPAILQSNEDIKSNALIILI